MLKRQNECSQNLRVCYNICFIFAMDSNEAYSATCISFMC